MTVSKKTDTINKMFDTIANKYDLMNNVISFGFHKFIKSKCINLLEIKDGYNIADLCSGTGDLAALIKSKNPRTNIIGVDFSKEMISIARKKNPNICFSCEDVTRLSFPDNTFDIVTIGFGLRNIGNAEKAIDEIYRILKPNGIFMHIDFGEKNLFSYIFDALVLFLSKILSPNYKAYSYLIKSKREFLEPADLIKDFESKQFKLIKRKDFLFKIISCQIMVK